MAFEEPPSFAGDFEAAGGVALLVDGSFALDDSLAAVVVLSVLTDSGLELESDFLPEDRLSFL